jgi:hypothetical protein
MKLRFAFNHARRRRRRDFPPVRTQKQTFRLPPFVTPAGDVFRRRDRRVRLRTGLGLLEVLRFLLVRLLLLAIY